MNDDTNLIDISMLQQLQDQFCCADHLYLMCVDKNKGVVTKPFGTEEQVGFLRTQVDKHAYMELVDQMQHDRMETVVERGNSTGFHEIVCCFHKSRRSAAGCLDCYGYYKGAADTRGSSAGGNAYYDGGAVLRIGRISITAFRTVV